MVGCRGRMRRLCCGSRVVTRQVCRRSAFRESLGLTHTPDCLSHVKSTAWIIFTCQKLPCIKDVPPLGRRNACYKRACKVPAPSVRRETPHDDVDSLFQRTIQNGKPNPAGCRGIAQQWDFERQRKDDRRSCLGGKQIPQHYLQLVLESNYSLTGPRFTRLAQRCWRSPQVYPSEARDSSGCHHHQRREAELRDRVSTPSS